LLDSRLSASHAAALLALAFGDPRPAAEPRIVPNDNRSAAGTAGAAGLEIALVVQLGSWYPEATDGPYLTVAAFGEEGKAPSIPGPLIRVKTGTLIRARIRNQLADSTIHLIGLGSPPRASAETLHVAPGGVRQVSFRAGPPGTYYYRAVVGHRRDSRQFPEHETAGGAIVVDPPGGSPPDRVFVLNLFSQPADSTGNREALAINGRAWPHTERLGLTVGDTARWRVINGTVREHPMHLHGFYFRIDATGNGTSSRTVPGPERSLGVTELMAPWATRSFTWSPDRPGNWLFHCHLTIPDIPDARLGHIHRPQVEIRETTSINPMQHMAGLVLGISVAPRPGASYRRAEPGRRLDLFVNEGPARGRMPRTFSYVLQEGATEPAADSVRIPGSLIVLTRGQPTDITVHNRAGEPVGIHWHGLELESWSDGVIGWSGQGTNTAPPILSGEDFTAHLSMPRAGTFIYHTHLNDIEQVTSGAIGPLVVVEPGQRFDPTRDHVYLGGWSGLDDVTSPGCVPPASEPKCWPRLMINGDTLGGPPLELRAGEKHRFRFINLSPAEEIEYSVRKGAAPVRWVARAKDGADLPPARRVGQPAVQSVSVGETYDFELVPAPGDLVLLAGFAGGPPSWTQRLVVR
jgi:FtsP/CotA-like multicopper oxidase with cupredoxin domain